MATSETPRRPIAPWFRALEEDDRFQDLLEHMRAIITEYDSEGRIVHVSSSVRTTLGFEPDELVGKSKAVLIHPDDLDATAGEANPNEQRVRRRTRWLRLRHKSGHWTWLESSATRAFTAPDGTTHGVAFSHDITELKRAEDELREKESRYRLVVEAADDVVVESDPGGRCVFWTANLGASLGYTAEEVIAMEPYHMVHRDDLENLQEEYRRALESYQPTRLPAYRARHHDGHWRWLQCSGVAYRHASGERRFLHVTRDVTERVEAAQQHVEQEARSQQAKRLESLGVMAGGIAHDFNNFLTPIMADASLTLADLPEDSPLRYRLERIQRTAQRAAELTRHMLAYAGAEEIEAEILELSSFVQETSGLLETALADKAVLELELAPNLPLVHGDPSQLTRVLMNLLTNAAEATEKPGGQVVVRTGRVELTDKPGPAALEGAVELGEHVFLEVEDGGCGMDANTQSRIFDPFFTTKFTGRGLGLASVLGILRAHRGSVEIDSRPGEGTRIRVLLPATEQTAAGALATPRDAELSPVRGATVLVIDDDEGTREVTAESLMHAGFRVLCAEDGETGVELFRKHAAEIEVVLLDRTMPGLSGEGTFDRLREIRDRVKIVLMSGYASKQAADAFAGKGLAGFIGKPFLPEDLVDQIRKILAEPTLE